MTETIFKYQIRLVLEGCEEETFFDLVQKLGVASNINLAYINARGFGNIAPIFQDLINNDEIDAVFAVYDVDYRYDELKSPFSIVQKQLKRILGSNSSVEAASLCTNPNILQMFLLGCDDLANVSLQKSSKTINSVMVNKYWPKIGRKKENEEGWKVSNDYKAVDWQLKIISDSFLYGPYSYNTILENSAILPTDYLHDSPGGNLYPFLMALKRGDVSFFEKLSNNIVKDEDILEE